jgi:CRP-like cAMP-binding protein
MAIIAVKCLELPLDSFADYRQLHPQIAMKIMRNLSALLARRLILQRQGGFAQRVLEPAMGRP